MTTNMNIDENDNDDYDCDNNNNNPPSTPFTLLQTRRFASSSTILRLCPSMDLLFVWSVASLTLYRSVTFQKLVTITTNDTATNEDTSSTMALAAWRPDGRWLACVSHSGHVVLQDLEVILSASSPVVMISMQPRDDTMPQLPFTSFAFPSSSSSSSSTTQLRVLVWYHVGKAHVLWSKHEDDDEEEWLYSWGNSEESLYLPYHKKKDTLTSTVPTWHTPLSLLVAISEDAGIYQWHGCLHGCYPILKQIPILSALRGEDVRVVTSTNLTQLAISVLSPQETIITLYSIPSLHQHRQVLQTISALYASTTTCLLRLQEALPEIMGAWKSSLKPLDMKLQGLVRLLENYGLFEATTLRQLLVQYILSGHTRAAPNLSNAMDQFFTGVQMNDQLIQRLEASLTVAVANVESQCREHLLEPAQACVHQFSTLHGLARQIAADPLLNDEDGLLLSAKHSLRCLQQAELLLLTVERTLVQLLEARIRLRDWVAWLRAVGAQIKARGTAPQSARHENARKRRVPDAVVQRLLRYLRESSGDEASDHTTESILHLQFAQLLQEIGSDDGTTTSMTLPQCFTAVQTSAEALFAGPPQCITQQMQTKQLFFGGSSTTQPMAMIIRMGQGNAATNEGLYCPAPDAARFRQWLLVARAADEKSCVDLYAIPLSWNGQNSVDFPQTWTSRFHLDGCDEILAAEFYSDDGKSNLSGESIGKEGNRQSLVVLMRVGNDVQLSVVRYDALELTKQPLKPKESNWVLPQPISTIQVQFNSPSFDEDGVTYAKTRTVSSYNGRACLVLSGSRGMAAVECPQDPEVQGVVWNLFDLEEDEEEAGEESLEE
ncbi:hypothetical protein FisN_40Lh004 [Fistulifera solaris]|uniref:Anaphase-promoting complex subunit 4 n=1 Tax=Fistulifera solaris TaxID=1519565 RepID=A0A1Z5J969_FISSO|nr:hypothetical protein FisN_40Lh004 [Fistulifera solaris]|eukprot:GAX10537.1 hypothetical protein FisN_40Lh004 [Fistulifera solaris]